jgi:GT2 family glycosyltransferase
MKKISIVIITYNRPDDVLLLLRNITEQDDAERLLESVIIIDNDSQASYEPVLHFIDLNPQIPFRYVHSAVNLGVAAGRNKAIALAKAPIIVTIDDDAYFKFPDSLKQIVRLFESNHARDNHIGAFCFKVFYGSTGELQANAFPHKQFATYKDKQHFFTYYFIGCGHAILKEVYDTTGLYPTDFFYGMEEYDLGYRILDAGYKIAYNDSVSIIHNESPTGRTPHAEKMQMLWVNKSKVAYRYLPMLYFWSTAILWSLQFLKKTSGSGKLFWEGWQKIFRIPRSEKRRKIAPDTLRYIREVQGRLWY